MRALAARYGVSDSTLMKRAGREHWAANRALASTTTDATVVATLQQRAEAFVNRTAELTDNFVTRVSESEAALETEDRHGLRLLTSAFKDVVSVGRDTYQLGREDGQARCLVNLSFLQSYEPVIPQLVPAISPYELAGPDAVEPQ
jgi:hypothetical protein